MARRYWLFRQTTARYATLESAVKAQIIDAAEDQGITVDADALTGEHRQWIFDRRYDWEIQPASGHYLVRETQSISAWWYGLGGLATLVGAIAVLAGPPEEIVALVGSLLSFALWVIPLLGSTPVEATVASNEDYRTHPAALIVLIVAGLLIAGTLAAGWVALTVTPGTWPVTILVGLTAVVMILLYRQQPSLTAFQPGALPHTYELVSGYLFYLLLGGTPISALVALRSVVQTRPPYGALGYLPFAVISGLILVVMQRLLTRQRRFTYYEVREGTETIAGRVRRGLLLVLLAAAAYGMGAVVLLFVTQYTAVLTGGDLLSRVLVGIALLPLLYVPAGVLVQTVRSVRDTLTLFLTSTPARIKPPGEMTPRIRTINTDQYIAGSYSLGFRDYIFVSEAVVQKLEREELDAVLAHEEGHLHHCDALFSVFMPIAAVMLMTGQNVLYTVLDFRTREFRADAYAVETVGRAPLERALRTIAATSREESALGSWVGGGPTFTSFSTPVGRGVVDRYFGAFFGNFALTEVHPGIEERIDHISGGGIESPS